MTERTFVDTNVWIYAVDDDEPVKQAHARAILTPEAGSDLVISAQVLGEFFVAVTRKLARPLSPHDAALFVARLSDLPVVALDARLAAAAIVGSGAWGISYWDALIVAAAEAAGCRRLLSEDLAHGATYGSVRVEDPFRDLPG